MRNNKVYRAIGLMSGTSADGVDAALIETDGYSYVRPIESLSMPYDQCLQDKIRSCFGLRDRGHPDVGEVESLLTHRHAACVVELMAKAQIAADSVDVVGFHGQTLLHIPDERLTWQIGDGGALARQLGIAVVNDFRSADVAAGGQGAPFLPLYHQARAHVEGLIEKAERSLAILNIGGVANVTWIGGQAPEDLIAFDTGPGNALMDDYIYAKSGQRYDSQGMIASTGEVDRDLVNRWMALPYFALPLPKSLDRNSWDVSGVEHLSQEDALATLAQFTVESVVLAKKMLPQKPKYWMVTGGGRHNTHLMALLSSRLNGKVCNIDEFGWDGDAVEAEGFGYLAVRSLLKLPLSLPSTTGVLQSQTGGVLHKG